MSRSKLALIAAMLLSTVAFVCYPQDSANAARVRYCAQHTTRDGTALGDRDCSFRTLDACRAHLRHTREKGRGRCYRYYI
jgi:hypothetical protein